MLVVELEPALVLAPGLEEMVVVSDMGRVDITCVGLRFPRVRS